MPKGSERLPWTAGIVSEKAAHKTTSYFTKKTTFNLKSVLLLSPAHAP